MRISNKELIAALVESGVKQVQAKSFIKAVFDVLKEGLEQDGKVKINGLGTFTVVTVEKRESVNVNTNKPLIIPEHKKIKFVADKQMKSVVNAQYADLQTEILDPIEKTWIEKLKLKIFK